MVCKPDCPDPWRTILDLILTQNWEHPDPEHLKLITNHLKVFIFQTKLLIMVHCALFLRRYRDTEHQKFNFSFNFSKLTCSCIYLICYNWQFNCSNWLDLRQVPVKKIFSFKTSSDLSLPCTEVRFSSFFSGGLNTVIVVNSTEKKLAKHSSVHCNWIYCYKVHSSLKHCLYGLCLTQNVGYFQQAFSCYVERFGKSNTFLCHTKVLQSLV